MRLPFLLFLLWALHAPAQNVPIDELIGEAEKNVFSQPDYSRCIAEYVLNQEKKSENALRSLLILTESAKVQGRTNDAVKYIIQAEILADEMNFPFLKIRVKLALMELMQELGLSTIAQDFQFQKVLRKFRHSLN